MNLSFVKNQSNINRSEKERKVKANFLSWDKGSLSSELRMSQITFLSQGHFLAFGTKDRTSAVKSSGWDKKIGQVVPRIFWTIYRNVRAYRTIGQLFYLCIYIFKKESIYKKNKEIGLGRKQQYSGVRKHVFFCPLVPRLFTFQGFSSTVHGYHFMKSSIDTLCVFYKNQSDILFRFWIEVSKSIFINFGLPVLLKLNSEFSFEASEA